MWEKQSAICFSYADSAFTQEMCKAFDHPVRGKDAARRLLSLHQVFRSVAELAIELGLWLRRAGGMMRPSKAFQNSLNNNIKDELVSLKEPEDLDELIFPRHSGEQPSPRVPPGKVFQVRGIFPSHLGHSL